MGARIGIFGGSFDPVHFGHIEAANSFLASGLIDELWIMPTPYPPHKQDSRQTEYHHRFQMLRIAFGDLKGVRISDLENSLPKPSYTLQTITHLIENYPGHTFFLCAGEDSISQFHHWHRYDEILQHCSLLTVRRPGSDLSETHPEILEKVIFVDHNPVDVSSSSIRKKKIMTAGIEIPEPVADYIQKNNLYQKND